MVFVQWGNEGESLTPDWRREDPSPTTRYHATPTWSSRIVGSSLGRLRLARIHMSYDICLRLHVIFTAEVKRYRIPEIRVSVWVRAFVTLCPPPGNQNSPHTMRIKVKVRILKRRTFDPTVINWC